MAARVIYHDFVNNVNNNASIPPQFDPALLAIVEIIRDGLVRDSHVRLHKFGTFRLKWGKPGRGKHPMTGKFISWPAQPRVTFTPSKHLRELVDPNPEPIMLLDEPDNTPTAPVTDTAANTKIQQQIKQTSTIPVPVKSTTEIPTLKSIPDVIAAARESAVKPTLVIEDEYIPEKYQQTDETNAIPLVDDIFEVENELHEAPVTNQQRDNKAKLPKSKKILIGAGMLALVPMIIMMLQSELSSQTNSSTVEKTPSTQVSQAAPVSQTIISEPKLHLTAKEMVVEPLTEFENNDFDMEATGIQNPAKTITEATIEETTITSAESFHLSPQVHTIEKFDNLWSLAEKHLGDGYLWPHIYRANLRLLDNPDKLTVGTQLVIPGLQQPAATLSENDRQLVAEGYYLLYQYSQDKNSPNAHHFLIGAKKYHSDWLQTQSSSISRKHRKYIK